jgi:protein-S-isoprenylcysteine O-methyltransferase Ste14
MRRAGAQTPSQIPERGRKTSRKMMFLRIGVFPASGYNAIGVNRKNFRGSAGMRNSAIARANYAILLAVFALSGVTMIWLFWHHPIKTLIGTIAVLVSLGISARLARAIEAEAATANDLDQHSV